jgi:hypothetical protein
VVQQVDCTWTLREQIVDYSFRHEARGDFSGVLSRQNPH